MTWSPLGQPLGMDHVMRLLDEQDGVISRRQALAAGMTPAAIARALRRRDLSRIHDGVYVNHTGHPTWRQRAWAAVHACWPAALTGESARRAHEGPGRHSPGPPPPIEVIVDHGRKVKAPSDVIVRRSRRFADLVQWNLSPPRVRYDDAILLIADNATDDLAAVATLADACGGRRTTAARLVARLEATPRLHRRDWLADILTDVAEGTCSVLEHGYLTLVERAHGLPSGLRQVPDRDRSGRRMYRDVVYGGTRPRWRQFVELDGRLFHDSVAVRERDLERDLDAAVELIDSIRLGYGQVFARGCATAYRLGIVFRRRGWVGLPHACAGCPAELAWPTAEVGYP